MPRRKPISKATRERLFKEAGGQCYICGWELQTWNMTVDHRIPWSRGGTNAYENLALACQPCNTGKGNKMPGDPPRKPKGPVYSTKAKLRDVWPTAPAESA